MNQYSEEDVVAYLNGWSSVERYYLYCFKDKGRVLINYFDDQGQGWSMMEDDDALVDCCVQYLRKYGAPEFNNVDELKKFESDQLNKND